MSNLASCLIVRMAMLNRPRAQENYDHTFRVMLESPEGDRTSQFTYLHTLILMKCIVHCR